MSKNELFDWRIDFRLSERCEYTSIENSNSIELQTETDQKASWITGFWIKIQGAIETEVVIEATNQAKILADIISVKRGRHVTSDMIGYMRLNRDGWGQTTSEFRIKTAHHSHVQLNLRDNSIAAMIKNDLPENQRFHHASLGLRAAELDLYEIMITEFFQVIKGSELSEVIDTFAPLRDALSHQEPLSRETKAKLEEKFGTGYFTVTRNGEFDHNSPLNREHLKEQAKKLGGIAMNYARTRIY